MQCRSSARREVGVTERIHQARQPCSARSASRGAIAWETAPRAQPVIGDRRVSAEERGPLRGHPGGCAA